MLNADLKEFEFISDFDKLVISAVLAVPSGDVHGIVQFVHGMNEHKERYYPFMDYLAEQGETPAPAESAPPPPYTVECHASYC